MEKKKMLAELTVNCKTKSDKLLDLLKVYELAEIGYEMQEQKSKDCYNQVLNSNEFFAEKDYSFKGIKKGDRITEEDDDWLLSENDFAKVQALALPILVVNKVTDDKGYYLEDWLGMKNKARNEMVDYFIKEIVPIALREILWNARKEYKWQKRLVDLVKQACGMK